MKKIRSIAVILITAGATFVSCKKDPLTSNNGSQPPASDAQLQIALNATYLPATKIDSAIAVWEVGGTTQTVKLQTSDNKLTTDLTHFINSGSGTLTVQLFTQSKVNTMPLQWEKRFAYTLNRKTAVQLAAPVDFQDASWNPRAISISQIADANAIVIIALRPEDSYFELKNIHLNIAKRIEVVRSFYLNDTTNLVASRGWIGQASNLDNKGEFSDRTHFADLTGQIAGRTWNKYKIRASFYETFNPNQVYEMEFVNDKP